MNDELFVEPVERVREVAVAHPDVKGLRERQGLSQTRFAGLPGISEKTLHNRERGRRIPKAPAPVLLKAADEHLEGILARHALPARDVEGGDDR